MRARGCGHSVCMGLRGQTGVSTHPSPYSRQGPLVICCGTYHPSLNLSWVHLSLAVTPYSCDSIWLPMGSRLSIPKQKLTFRASSSPTGPFPRPPKTFCFFFSKYLLCVYGLTHAKVWTYAQKSENNCVGLVLSFHLCMDAGSQTQAVKITYQAFKPLGYLSGPVFAFLIHVE